MATKVKVSFDLVKLKEDIIRESRAAGLELVDKMPLSQKKVIGNEVINQMKNLISKGISPIANQGRFGAYKWVGRSVDLLKKANASAKRAWTKGKAKKIRANARKTAAQLKKGKYPFSAQKEFPGKRERPVNLKLSGSFLNNLECRPSRKGLEIGFYDEPYTLMEEGHREGVGGQPKRPIIPQGSETFSRAILQNLLSKVVAALLRARVKRS